MRDEVRDRVPIGVDLEDSGLERALLKALGAYPGLRAAQHDETAELVITDSRREAYGARLLRVGDEAAGLPPDDPDLILAATLLVAHGYTVRRAAEGHGADAGAAPAPHLTARERQVLDLLIGGASNKHIANALDISVHTAKFHVTALREKLGAHNRADLVAIALRQGLVTL